VIIRPSRIPDVLIIEADVFSDDRGFFMETWHAERFAEHGCGDKFVQDNHSRSEKNVLRGLHYQLEQPQGKLVRVVNGAVFDVAVDIRRGSPTFGQWVGLELTGDNNRQIYVPPGFAHGFCVLSDSADFLYKCTEYYAPDDEYGLLWNDPDIGIDWPGHEFTISKKDAKNSLLRAMHDRLPVYGEKA